MALEKLTESAHGQLLYELPHLRRDDRTHLLLAPRELIEQLCRVHPFPAVLLASLSRNPGPTPGEFRWLKEATLGAIEAPSMLRCAQDPPECLIGTWIAPLFGSSPLGPGAADRNGLPIILISKLVDEREFAGRDPHAVCVDQGPLGARDRVA